MDNAPELLCRDGMRYWYVLSEPSGLKPALPGFCRAFSSLDPICLCLASAKVYEVLI